MNEEQVVPSCRLTGMAFSLFSVAEIRRLSVKEVTNPQTFDVLMHPNPGGLHDPAFGPADWDEVCETCGMNSIFCPGHMGHIALPMPVYNPLLFQTMFKLLQGSCVHCHRLYMPRSISYLCKKQMQALNFGLLRTIDELRDILSDLQNRFGNGINTMFEEVKSSLDRCVDEALIGVNISEENASRVKNLSAYRHALLKSFMKNCLYKKLCCPHCHQKICPFRHEHCSRVFSGKITATPKKRKAEPKKTTNVSSEDGMAEPEIVEVENEILEKEDSVQKQSATDEKQNDYFTPMMVRHHLRLLWGNEEGVLREVFGALNVKMDDTSDSCPTDVFFLEVMPVVPSRFRPIAMLRERRFENPQTANLAKILTDAATIRDVLTDIKGKRLSGNKDQLEEIQQASDGDKDLSLATEKLQQAWLHMQASDGDKDLSLATEKLQQAWLHMQVHVNAAIDSDLDRLNTEKNPGIKQLLEKKEGLFRKHMMGKRVDYACRSVISPDPYIGTNEIGVPLVFAKKLTYAQPVTPWNFQQLKQMVINGPQQHPGANYIINPDGIRVMLSATDQTQREAIAKQLLTPIPGMNPIAPNRQVCRHLMNGDMMLLNRQPTLHRPSIQAHKVRVLPGEKTLRLHYANCKAYNADFDGDEMNAHFPQNELCRSEAYNIASTDFQYLVPKDGSPLAGLIQDHMVSGVMLTMRGRFFTRSDYNQLVYSALTDKWGRVRHLPPSILKPHTLWSGKQVFSTVLLNILPDGKAPLNLHGSTKISGRTWINGEPRPWIAGGSLLQGDDMSESEVIIHQGELLVGILDKAHYGATAYGLVHSCYELYGGRVAGELLTGLAKLFTTFLQFHGFTLGVEDILVTSKADAKRRKLMMKASQCGSKVAAQAFMIDDSDDSALLERKLQEAHFSRDPGSMKDLDLSMKAATDKFQNKIAKACIPSGLEKKFPHNNLQLMVLSGAKGSSVNCMQISCLLGQIELEGHRPSLMLNGKSLPSFLLCDTSPRAGGFIDGRFLTGIRPQEYFFHCMAGREGLVDTAVKTSRSGYLQRCIVKHLEGISVNYDLTVRDSDHSVIQFQYGEDGLDVLKTQFLNKSQFSFLIQNEKTFVSGDDLKARLGKLDSKTASSMWKKIRKWKRKHGDDDEEKDTKPRHAPFLFYSRKQMSRDRRRPPEERIFTPEMDALATSKLMRDMWHQLSGTKKTKYALDGKYTKCPEPVLSRIRPDRNFGAISERLEEVISGYLASNPDQLLWYHHEKPLAGHVTAERFETMMKLRALESLAQPGESVGLIAAQSIGEPSTQMTLNTFHFAGRGEMNVTLGIPRMREILMVGSENIMTPTMEVCLQDIPNAAHKGKLLKLKFNKVYLSQVLEDVEVTERMSVKHESNKCRIYTLRLNFLPSDMYSDEYILTPRKIIELMERKVLRRLQDAILKQQNDLKAVHLVTMAKLRQTTAPCPGAGDGAAAAAGEEEDVSDDDQNDGDATAVKSRERQNQEMDYVGEEEEKEEMGDVSGNESDVDDTEMTEDGGNEVEGEGEAEGEGEGEREGTERVGRGDVSVGKEDGTKKRRKSSVEMDAKRISNVLSSAKLATSYRYDVVDELWCEVTFKLPLTERKVDMTSVIEKEAKRTVLYQVPGISRCFLSQNRELGREGTMKLRFEGVNLQELYNYADILKLNELYTNNIHAMAKTYGIEAACRVIIKEIRDVFMGYGIQVDYHHLSLVADYMTFEGEYKSFSRIGIESNASPLQKMTFETTMHFLKMATIQGACDELKSPSSRLITGRLVGVGTGAFDVVLPANKC